MRLDRLLAVAAAAILVALGACAPAAREVARPVVVVVAGPTERPLAGLEEAARQEFRRAGFAGSFAPQIASRIAQYRNLSAQQAVRSTAEIGRIVDADLGLYVGVERLERDVDTDRRGMRRQVTVRLQLRATLVDPYTGALLWSTRDAVRTVTRVESSNLPLPRVEADPGARELRDASLRHLMAEAVARVTAAEP